MQHRGDGVGGLAATIAHIDDSEPEREDALYRVGRVAPLIAPLLVSRMRCGPVEFYANPVFVIEIVQVPAARVLPDPRLPSRGRQPMRTFDAADVAMLQNRQDSLIDAAERRCDL